MSWIRVISSTSVLLAMPFVILRGTQHSTIFGASLATSGLIGIIVSQWVQGNFAFSVAVKDNVKSCPPTRSAIVACQMNPQPLAFEPEQNEQSLQSSKNSGKRNRKLNNPPAANTEPWQRTKASALLRKSLFPPHDYSGCDGSGNEPSRRIVCADALDWLEAQEVLPGAIFTSMPDLSEIDMIVSALASALHTSGFLTCGASSHGWESPLSGTRAGRGYRNAHAARLSSSGPRLVRVAGGRQGRRPPAIPPCHRWIGPNRKKRVVEGREMCLCVCGGGSGRRWCVCGGWI